MESMTCISYLSGTSGAPFMDYIVTDAQTSPLKYSERQYSEKLAYMPHTFFIGDHKQMFPHLTERIIVASDSNKTVNADGSAVPDNVAVINAVDKSVILEKVCNHKTENFMRVLDFGSERIFLTFRLR